MDELKPRHQLIVVNKAKLLNTPAYLKRHHILQKTNKGSTEAMRASQLNFKPQMTQSLSLPTIIKRRQTPDFGQPSLTSLLFFQPRKTIQLNKLKQAQFDLPKTEKMNILQNFQEKPRLSLPNRNYILPVSSRNTCPQRFDLPQKSTTFSPPSIPEFILNQSKVSEESSSESEDFYENFNQKKSIIKNVQDILRKSDNIDNNEEEQVIEQQMEMYLSKENLFDMEIKPKENQGEQQQIHGILNILNQWQENNKKVLQQGQKYITKVDQTQKRRRTILKQLQIDENQEENLENSVQNQESKEQNQETKEQNYNQLPNQQNQDNAEKKSQNDSFDYSLN